MRIHDPEFIPVPPGVARRTYSNATVNSEEGALPANQFVGQRKRQSDSIRNTAATAVLGKKVKTRKYERLTM